MGLVELSKQMIFYCACTYIASFRHIYHCYTVRLSELSARALVESMQIQAHLYEEWLEVMGDYSTVFSEERGIAENHYSEEVSDSNQQNSATVSV